MKPMHYEKGATLIVVLILLLLISVVGLYAIRHSVFNLKLATNAQVQTLLMQTTDVALSHLERNFNTNVTSNLAGTPVGQVLLDGNQGKELQFCFKPTEIGSNDEIKNNLFFDLSSFRIIERESPSSLNASSSIISGDYNAVCNPTTMFSISRKAIVTQVSVDSPDDPSIELSRFELSTKNTDLKETNIETKRVRVTATSFAPALAPSVSISDMNTCLQGRMMDDMLLNNKADSSSSQIKVQTLHECLNALGVPLNTQVAEYVVNLTQSRS